MTTQVDAADLHSLGQPGFDMPAASHGRPDAYAAGLQLAGGPTLPLEQVVEVQQGDTLMGLLIDAGVARADV